MKCKDLVNINILICFDSFTEEQEKYFKEKGVTLIPYHKIIESGEKNMIDYNLP
jgi:hypothetical protein